MEHTPIELVKSKHVQTAVQNFRVYDFKKQNDNVNDDHDETPHALGTFQYDIGMFLSHSNKFHLQKIISYIMYLFIFISQCVII